MIFKCPYEGTALRPILLVEQPGSRMAKRFSIVTSSITVVQSSQTMLLLCWLCTDFLFRHFLDATGPLK